MKIRTIGIVGAASVLVLAAGCTVEKVRQPPVSVEQYELAKTKPNPYAARTIAQHNLQRALDPDLGESERVESLRLMAHLGEGDPRADEQLAALLESDDASEALHRSALELLILRGRGGLARHIVRVLPKLSADSKLKGEVLTWLERNPDPNVLPEVVRLWAAEASTTSPDEPRYRGVVAGASGTTWQQALLGELNRTDSKVQGEALELLAGRLSKDKFGLEITTLPARTKAVAAMQAFLLQFNYLPTTAGEMAACISLHDGRQASFGEAGNLCRRWQVEDGYEFNVRDLQLLSRLAQDPLRRNLRRTDMVVAISAALMERRHVPRHESGPAGAYGFSDRFEKHMDSLSMADLWTVLLLHEMLSVPTVRRSTALLVAHDQNDPRSALGGLVMWQENARPVARVYWPVHDGEDNDLAYRLTAKGLQDAPDSLCRFQAHFEQTDNAGRAGPTALELAGAHEGNWRGLILTSLSGEECCAHLYTPRGVVISLGALAFQ